MPHFSFDQRVENLFKSYFSTYSNINIELNEKKISIHIIDANNHDSASIDLIKFEDFHQITFTRINRFIKILLTPTLSITKFFNFPFQTSIRSLRQACHFFTAAIFFRWGLSTTPYEARKRQYSSDGKPDS